MITSLSELYFRFKIYSVVTNKKVISMSYGSTTSRWKPWWWMRPDQIFTMRDIYIHSNLNTIAKFTSSRSTTFKYILSWNISQITTKTALISIRIVISHAMKKGIPFWVLPEVNGNWDNNMTTVSQWREYLVIVEQILASKEITPKERDCESNSQWFP